MLVLDECNAMTRVDLTFCFPSGLKTQLGPDSDIV